VTNGLIQLQSGQEKTLIQLATLSIQVAKDNDNVFMMLEEVIQKNMVLAPLNEWLILEQDTDLKRWSQLNGNAKMSS
jgi:hypothetical protein